jgi:hypothetical protein
MLEVDLKYDAGQKGLKSPELRLTGKKIHHRTTFVE